MTQYQIGDIVLKKGTRFAGYITAKYTSVAGTPMYDLYYWFSQEESVRFVEDELEPLTMENVYRCR